MKKLHWIISLTVLAGIGYAIASPFIAIENIKSAVNERDSEQLSDNIDFPVLRQNLKEQLNAYMMKEAGSDLQDNPFGVLAIGFASKLTDGIVDSFVTPSGLASLMEGKEPAKSVYKSSNPKESDENELFRNARYTFDSFSKFSVWVPNNKGEEIRFVLGRSGIKWKLVNIILPA